MKSPRQIADDVADKVYAITKEACPRRPVVLTVEDRDAIEALIAACDDFIDSPSDDWRFM